MAALGVLLLLCVLYCGHSLAVSEGKCIAASSHASVMVTFCATHCVFIVAACACVVHLHLHLHLYLVASEHVFCSNQYTSDIFLRVQSLKM